VSHVLKLQKHVPFVLETESTYMIVIVQPDIMKLLMPLIVQLVHLLVKNVLVMKFAQNVTPTGTYTKIHVHHHVQQDITDLLPITHVMSVKLLVQPVTENTTTTVLLVQLVIT